MFGLMFGAAILVGVLSVYALVLNAPLIALVFLTRQRFGRAQLAALLAAGFAVATAYMIWRMEWFDVWRHGTPPIGYILTSMFPYTSVVAGFGWLLGRVIARPRAT